MSAQQLHVDVISNNIANVNSTGFKKQRVNFQDMMYAVETAPGTRAGDEGMNPHGSQYGHGVRVSGTPRVFTPGNVENTGVQTDIAIEGDGFFEISLPDGSVAYTRAGDFGINPNGQFVTPDGYFLEPRITVPEDTSQISVGTNGVVTVLVGNTQTEIGQLSIAKFRNNSGLVSVGRNLFQETVASGNAQTGTPGDPGFGLLRGGALERSNVDVVVELVNMIVAQRAYELNSRSIRTSDEMLQQANDIAS